MKACPPPWLLLARRCVEAIAGDIKEATCRVSDNVFDPEENANIPTVLYELPDGQV